MIQRIQTVFLLLATGGVGSLFVLPLATSERAVVASDLFDDALYELADHPALLALFGLGGLTSLASIFLYKNRPLQMRLTVLALLLVLSGGIFALVHFYRRRNPVMLVSVEDGPAIYLILPILLLFYLAHRYIRKDQQLVRSMDRLR